MVRRQNSSSVGSPSSVLYNIYTQIDKSPKVCGRAQLTSMSSSLLCEEAVVSIVFSEWTTVAEARWLVAAAGSRKRYTKT